MAKFDRIDRRVGAILGVSAEISQILDALRASGSIETEFAAAEVEKNNSSAVSILAHRCCMNRFIIIPSPD
jgi:hypothetical protein